MLEYFRNQTAYQTMKDVNIILETKMSLTTISAFQRDVAVNFVTYLIIDLPLLYMASKCCVALSQLRLQRVVAWNFTRVAKKMVQHGG